MEVTLFHKPAVRRELDWFVEARLHCDGDTGDRPRIARENKAFQKEMTNTLGNPIFVVVDPKTGEPLLMFPRATFDEDEFADFLRQALKMLS